MMSRGVIEKSPSLIQCRAFDRTLAKTTKGPAKFPKRFAGPT